MRWEKDVEDAAAGALQRPLLYKRGTNTTSQMAIVGANTCPIESLDYEYARNALRSYSIETALWFIKKGVMLH